MLGPVVGMELLRAGRRGRAHVLVWLFAGWLVLQSLYLYGQYDKPDRRLATISDTAAFAHSFVDLVLGQQLFLVMLVTPAFAAGAITDEKTRGTLQSLLTADLTPAAIVLGKVCARATQVIVLGLTPLPLVALVGPYAGVTPEFLVIWLAVTTLLVVGLSAAGILASVWTKQTRNAVLLTYFSLIGLWWLFAHGPAEIAQHIPAEWWEAFDPLRPLLPALDRPDTAEAFRRLAKFAVAWGGLGAVCATMAVWRLRPAYLRQLDARPRRWLGLAALRPRPAPADNALAWKERYVGRRVPLWLGVPLTAAASAWATVEALEGMSSGFRPQAGGLVFLSLGWWVLLLLTLIVGVRASGTITGERERQTWDGLLTTPLTARDIVRGKLRGILMSVWPYLLTFSIIVPAAAGWSGQAGVEVIVVIPLVLTVTWLSLYFMGAVGLYCSARSVSSWRSLVTTVALGYVGGFVLSCVGTPLACIVGLIVTAIQETFLRWQGPSGPPLFMWEVLGPLAWALGVALVYWWAARSLLERAEKHIAQQDRIVPRVRLIDVPFAAPRRRRPS